MPYTPGSSPAPRLTAFMQSDEAAVNLAAVMALRDAGANFTVNFTRVPDVQQWLQLKRDDPEEADHG